MTPSSSSPTMDTYYQYEDQHLPNRNMLVVKFTIKILC